MKELSLARARSKRAIPRNHMLQVLATHVGAVETPILVVRETSPVVTSAYYFILCFPYYVGFLLSFISYLNSLFISFLFSFII